MPPRSVLALAILAAASCAPAPAAVVLVPPTETFKDEMSVQLGRREVKILHLGRGNTAGDAMVYVPETSERDEPKPPGPPLCRVRRREKHELFMSLA